MDFFLLAILIGLYYLPPHGYQLFDAEMRYSSAHFQLVG